jgi:hypothetical protein
MTLFVTASVCFLITVYVWRVYMMTWYREDNTDYHQEILNYVLGIAMAVLVGVRRIKPTS